MSHVDEGLIHAYLDGAFPPGSAQGEEVEAHLAVCVDCRVLLEKAREVKERAHMVMNRLAPTGIAAPPFEEILARRARSSGAIGGGAVEGEAGVTTRADAADDLSRVRRRRLLPPLPLAWAATLILAVGAGWMVRAYLGPAQLGAGGEAATSAADVATEPEAESATLRDEARLRLPPATPADLGAAASGRAGEPAATEQRGASQESRVSNAAPSEAAAKAAVAQAEAPPPTAPPPVPEPPALLGRSSAAFAPAAEQLDTAGPLPESQLVAAYGRATTAGLWQPEPVAGTLPLIGYRPIARLEGAEVVRAERATIDAHDLLRIVYRIEGDTVELVQRLEAVPVSLDAIVVTGAGSDTVLANREAVALRTDSQRRARAAGVAADARLERTVAARTVQPLRLEADGAPALRGRSLVLVAEGGRQAVLIGAVDAVRLQRLAVDVRR